MAVAYRDRRVKAGEMGTLTAVAMRRPVKAPPQTLCTLVERYPDPEGDAIRAAEQAEEMARINEQHAAAERERLKEIHRKVVVRGVAPRDSSHVLLRPRGAEP